jgi:hypothetical protein
MQDSVSLLLVVVSAGYVLLGYLLVMGSELLYVKATLLVEVLLIALDGADLNLILAPPFIVV